MTKISDTAAVASIGAATRELRLPVVRTEAARLAEAAQRDRVQPSRLSRRRAGRRSRRAGGAPPGLVGSPRPAFRASSAWVDFDVTANPGVTAETVSLLASCELSRPRRAGRLVGGLGDRESRIS